MVSFDHLMLSNLLRPPTFGTTEVALLLNSEIEPRLNPPCQTY